MSQEYCGTLPDDLVNDTCTIETGKVVAVGYIDPTTYAAWVDFSSNVEWAAAITAGTVIPVYNTRLAGDATPTTWTETDNGFGLTDAGITGASFELNYQHRGVNTQEAGAAVNIVNYTEFAKAPNHFHFYYVTGNFDLRVTSDPVVVLPQDVIEQGLTGEQYWNVTVKNNEFQIITREATAPVITYNNPAP